MMGQLLMPRIGYSGRSVGTLQQQAFTGDGATNVFTLSWVPQLLLVFVGPGFAHGSGVDYTLSGATVTFSAGQTPANGQAISFVGF